MVLYTARTRNGGYMDRGREEENGLGRYTDDKNQEKNQEYDNRQLTCRN